MAEWKFSRRQGRCGTCECAFEEGARHVSVLSARAEDLVREDACLACFGKRARDADIFWWFTRQSAGRRGLQLDLPTLEQLFIRLEGRDEVRIRELRYVLCLLLMRKRRLKLERVVRAVGSEGSAGSAGDAMVVRRPRRDESFQVQVFDFEPARMEELRGELLAIFEGAEPETRAAEAGDSEAGSGAVGEEAEPPALTV